VCSLFMRPSWNWKHAILYTLLFAGKEDTKSWRARKGDLQRAFVLMFRWFTHRRSPLLLTVST
jgi:hypothetical protein